MPASLNNCDITNLSTGRDIVPICKPAVALLPSAAVQGQRNGAPACIDDRN